MSLDSSDGQPNCASAEQRCQNCDEEIDAEQFKYCDDCHNELLYMCRGCDELHEYSTTPSLTLYEEAFCKKTFWAAYHHLGYTLFHMAFPTMESEAHRKYFDLLAENADDRSADQFVELSVIRSIMEYNDWNMTKLVALLEGVAEQSKKNTSQTKRPRSESGSDSEEHPKKKINRSLF